MSKMKVQFENIAEAREWAAAILNPGIASLGHTVESADDLFSIRHSLSDIKEILASQQHQIRDLKNRIDILLNSEPSYIRPGATDFPPAEVVDSIQSYAAEVERVMAQPAPAVAEQPIVEEHVWVNPELPPAADPVIAPFKAGDAVVVDGVPGTVVSVTDTHAMVLRQGYKRSGRFLFAELTPFAPITEVDAASVSAVAEAGESAGDDDEVEVEVDAANENRAPVTELPALDPEVVSVDTLRSAAQLLVMRYTPMLVAQNNTEAAAQTKATAKVREVIAKYVEEGKTPTLANVHETKYAPLLSELREEASKFKP
jgi:hypothetical protein